MKNTVNQCSVCQKQTQLKCYHCQSLCCKKCSYIIDEDCFDLFSLLPEEVQYKNYCPTCYHDHIFDLMEKYKINYQKAQNVDVYMKVQSAETRLIRRIEKPIQVSNCTSKEQALLKLAFLTVEKGFETMVDVNLTSTKSKQPGSYQKLIWNGSAVPVDPKIKK